jgi:hypothetical protein
MSATGIGREVPGESLAHGGCCLLVLDLGCYEGVVAGDFAVCLGGHDGAGSVALLALSCVGDEPAIKRRLAAAELIDAVGLAVERGGCAELRRHASGRMLGFSMSRRRPRSEAGEGCSSAVRNRCAASSSRM